jgi:hypothetical protein
LLLRQIEEQQKNSEFKENQKTKKRGISIENMKNIVYDIQRFHHKFWLKYNYTWEKAAQIREWVRLTQF